MRADIQGLRAVAVGVVLVYHVAPSLLPGGFVGVDAFFVISGFLITSHLLAHPPATGRDLATFWSRRIRRLLPASVLVLATTLVASRLIAPDTAWDNTARQARAAGLYVVNWLLAHDAVDYLAAENKPTPVQHFWSLSVEEQFYAVWPILILLLVAAARRTRLPPMLLVTTGLGVVVAASLTYSIVETATDPAAAYFITPTRIWELGIGGLVALACAPRVLGRPDAVRTPPRPIALALGWAGIAAIALSVVTYSGSTPFPGWQALLPVLGTAAVIAAHPTRTSTSTRTGTGTDPLGRLLALRPVQWLGDVSYSVYLWHWPLVVLLPYLSGGTLGNLDRLVIIVTTLVLAALTKRFVEDPFRRPGWARPLRRPYLLGATLMALVVLLASAQSLEVDHRQHLAQQQLAAALATAGPCFGAAALTPGRTCPTTTYDHIVPAPADAPDDKSDAYADVGGKNCWAYTPTFPEQHCVFGDADATTRIALVGNSHAGQWLPALQALAKAHHWRIDTFLASRCASADVRQVLDTDQHSSACESWVRRTVAAVTAAKPDLVVMTNRISVPAAGHTLSDSGAAYRQGYAQVMKAWADAGLRVLALHDTPAPGQQIPDCVATHSDDTSACDGKPSDWIPDDPVTDAVRDVASPRVRSADLDDHICSATVCRAVTGGVITYFDGSHLTATYARTLAPYLDVAMQRLLRG
ncbi:acyltransferase family protein [Nocardioides mangrovicus]|uniref:acyltransferase family protein n=1 Tax=Nocardioides mangrovicus TaxID=2478913 RepID=UPI0013141BED|nr:acyltransferase family protein [Nocardioides mangrovicus]